MFNQGYSTGYSLSDIAAVTGANGRDNNGFGDDWWILILFFALFGGWGGNGAGFGGNGGSAREAVSYGFDMNGLENCIRGIQQGLCEGFYAVNTGMLNGFHGVDNAICTLGYQTQQGFNTLGYQMKDCCCETQRAIDGVNFNIAQGLCDIGNVINMQTRDIIENQNANYRGIMDFMVQEKLANKDARIVELTNQISQLNQNAVIGARIDAAVAEVLRRTGNDCPTAAYIVQPPTPVNFPTNCCGTVQFGGWGQRDCGCCYNF